MVYEGQEATLRPYQMTSLVALLQHEVQFPPGLLLYSHTKCTLPNYWCNTAAEDR